MSISPEMATGLGIAAGLHSLRWIALPYAANSYLKRKQEAGFSETSNPKDMASWINLWSSIGIAVLGFAATGLALAYNRPDLAVIMGVPASTHLLEFGGTMLLFLGDVVRKPGSNK